MADKIQNDSWDNLDKGVPNFEIIDSLANEFDRKAAKQNDPARMIWLPESTHRDKEQLHVQTEGKETELTPAQEWQKLPETLNTLEFTQRKLRERNPASPAAQDAKDNYDVKVAEARRLAAQTLLRSTFSGKISKNSFKQIETGLRKHNISLITVDGKAPQEE